MVDEAVLRRLLEDARASMTSTYEARVERYGPDAARSLLDLYRKLEELVNGHDA